MQASCHYFSIKVKRAIQQGRINKISPPTRVYLCDLDIHVAKLERTKLCIVCTVAAYKHQVNLHFYSSKSLGLVELVPHNNNDYEC